MRMVAAESAYNAQGACQSVPIGGLVVYVSYRRLLSLALAALFALSVLSVTNQATASILPAPTTSTGGPDASAQKYRWVDSSAPGCLAPALIGSGVPVPPAGPAKGCPNGWDEIISSSTVTSKMWLYGDSYYQVYSFHPSSPSYWLYNNFYGSSTGSYSWNVNENGFLGFNSYGNYCGTGTRTPSALPVPVGGGSACSSTMDPRPANIVAGLWTNLETQVTWFGSCYTDAGWSSGTCPSCWDTPPAPAGFPAGESPGQVWGYDIQAGGSYPVDMYAVIEFDRVLVNPGDGGCNASPTPNHYATFEYKIYSSTNTDGTADVIDVVYKDVDTGGQAYSLGIDNSVGTMGLNYCFASCGAGASTHVTDWAIRYFPNHGVTAQSGAINIREDCAVGSPPTTYDCTSAMPDKFGFDPDYGDSASYCLATAPTRGTIAAASVMPCASGYGPVAGTYAPYLNYNGPDSYSFRVQGTDMTTAGPATISMTLRPVNDAPVGATQNYNVLASDSLYVTPSEGVILGGLDPENSPQRSTWGCATGPGCSTALMTEAGPTQTLTADMTGCPTFAASWNPLHGTVTYSPPAGGSLAGVHPDGSFNYVPTPGYTGPDAFNYCLYDGVAYGPAAVVNLNILPGSATFKALADTLTINEDAALTATGVLAPAANDVVSGCGGGGVQYQLIAGSGPMGTATFSWFPAAGTFTYTPPADWSGNDGFWYQLYCPGSGVISNRASVRIVVVPGNDQPTFTSWLTGGDTILEDGGVGGATTPPPYVRTVANFVSGISPGGGADELASQTVRAVIVSQTNTAMFSSFVPCANYAFGSSAACPATPGPALTITGPIGTQVASLTYTTIPDANGLDTVCWRLMDDGGTAGGAQDQNPMPPTAPLCFDITLNAVADTPRPGLDVYTIYKNHELYAPAPAVAAPVAFPAVPTVLGGPNPDVEADGEPISAVLNAYPYGTNPGKLWYLTPEGAFHYTPVTNFVGTDVFKYTVKDSAGSSSLPAVVTINILPNSVPTAAFTSSATAGTQGETLSFISSCADPDVAPDHIAAYVWDFGDGFTSMDASPVHAFEGAGTFTVTLTCYDTNGDSASVSHQIRISFGGAGAQSNPIEDFGTGPVAYAGENQNVPEGVLVNLHGTAAGGFQGSAYTFQWTQISGLHVDLDGAATPDATFTAPTYQGAGPQAIVLQLVASDGGGTSTPSIVQISVHSTNHAPIVPVLDDERLPQGTTATLDAAAVTDADDDTLLYEWTQLSGAPVCFVPSIGDCTVGPARSTAKAPAFTVPDFDGQPMMFQLVVSDGQARASATLSVLALPPDAAAAGFTYDVTRTATGTHVVFHPNVSGSSYVWDFGDGQGGATDASPAYDYDKSGTYLVKMSVIDGTGLAQAFEKPITVSSADYNRVPAEQVTKESPGPELFGVLMLLGCAVLLGRRRSA